MKLKERKIHGQYVKHRVKSGDRKRRLRRPQNKETGKKKKENKSKEDIKAEELDAPISSHHILTTPLTAPSP